MPEGVGGSQSRGSQPADRAGDQAAEQGEPDRQRDQPRSTGASSATFAVPDVIAPWPKPPLRPPTAPRPPAPPGGNRPRGWPDRADDRGAADPDRAPKMPPSAPCASDSPVTWRTTCRPGQPSAFSVPSSRMRFVTDESVNSEAIRNAATSADDRQRDAELA